MANGALSMATKRGMIKLKSKLFFCDVLYVLGSNCNLTNIIQLIKELLCIVTFPHMLCVIQDHTTRTPIKVGEQTREFITTKMSYQEIFKQLVSLPMICGING